MFDDTLIGNVPRKILLQNRPCLLFNLLILSNSLKLCYLHLRVIVITEMLNPSITRFYGNYEFVVNCLK